MSAARAGFRVLLEDVMPTNLHHAQEALRAELGPEAAGAHAGSGVQFVSTIEDAVRDADLAIDCVPDELESKLEIFCMVDRMAPPRTILLTPSNALSITDLASCTYRGDRCFAVRGWTPGGAGVGPVRLLHPVGANVEALAAVREFLSASGAEVMVEADPDAPMLVKNLR